MISRVEALGYRCLRYVKQDLLPFHVLVGPNASGKSTLLDVFDFLSDVVLQGPLAAASKRAPDVRDLLWMRKGDRFELAVEVVLPEALRGRLKGGGYTDARYEVSVGLRSDTEEVGILAETLWLTKEPEAPSPARTQCSLFPEPPQPPDTIVRARAPRGWRKVVNKVAESGNDYFSSETSGWNNLFRLGPQRSALANLPEDETKFPVATWFKQGLAFGVWKLALSPERMGRPSPPGALKALLLPDGSNLPWVVNFLQEADPERFSHWVQHVRTALPDLKHIETIERSEDRHCYLRLEFGSGVRVPAWGVSDGTLRLLALTLLAYLPPNAYAGAVLLVEEPENGIHPRAVETVFQSLSSVYGMQVLLATHSPVILSIAKPEEILCFAKTRGGATAIVCGSDHPQLRDWKGETDLGTLFASGVLG